MEIKALVKRKYIVEIEGEAHLPRMLEWKRYTGAGSVSVKELPDVRVDNGTAFLMTVLAESISECDREADAQIQDGFFENDAVTYVTPIM